MLESGSTSADEIAAVVGYDNAAFFRRLFKRSTGLTPARIGGCSDLCCEENSSECSTAYL